MKLWALVLSVCLLALLVVRLEARSRTNEVELSRLLGRLRREPGNAQVLREIGGCFALRASEQGYPSDAEEARKYLKQAEEIDPGDPKLVAWKGILRLVEAKIKSSKGYAREGLELLDRAIQMDSRSVAILMMRGLAALEVPREFNRLAQGITDLEMVEQVYRTEPARFAAAELESTEVHLKLGNGYRAVGDMRRAIVMWQQAAANSSNTKDAESARRLLRKYADGSARLVPAVR